MLYTYDFPTLRLFKQHCFYVKVCECSIVTVPRSSLVCEFLPRVHACAARGKAIGLSVVCRLLFVSIKIGKSQHLSESGINKWDKMMCDSEKTPSVSFLTLGSTQGSYKSCKYDGHAYVGHAHLVPYGVYCACSSFWSLLRMLELLYSMLLAQNPCHL